MKPPVPAPRLLPATIALLAMVLAARTVALVRAALSSGPSAAFVAAAWAGAEPPPPHDKPAAKPEAKPAGEAAKTEKPAEPQAADAPPPGPPPVSESEKKVLLDLRARRQELEQREAEIAARESVVGAAEQKLSSRVDELKTLQQKLETLDGSRKEQEEHAWQGLVKVYETMKPRDAAAIFDDLGMPVLLAVIDRMKEAKAAAILAAMLPDKAREVTTQLALSRTRAAAAIESGKAPASAAKPGSGT